MEEKSINLNNFMISSNCEFCRRAAFKFKYLILVLLRNVFADFFVDFMEV